MTVGLFATAIFGDLSGYFFGNFTDMASNIMTICYPLLACDFNTAHALHSIDILQHFYLESSSRKTRLSH